MEQGLELEMELELETEPGLEIRLETRPKLELEVELELKPTYVVPEGLRQDVDDGAEVAHSSRIPASISPIHHERIETKSRSIGLTKRTNKRTRTSLYSKSICGGARATGAVGRTRSLIGPRSGGGRQSEASFVAARNFLLGPLT